MAGSHFFYIPATVDHWAWWVFGLLSKFMRLYSWSAAGRKNGPLHVVNLVDLIANFARCLR
jgi:hypothetical protein